MLLLARQPNSLFLGQGVLFDGVAIFRDLNGVPNSQRIEMPVAEELQVGISVGLSLQGYLPISIFPRFDFMLRAADQIVNHLDKLEIMSCRQFRPKVILRTKVGSKSPLDAGPQHTQDHTNAFDEMLRFVRVFKITAADQILKSYKTALEWPGSSLMVECI